MQDYLIAIGTLRALHRQGIAARLWLDGDRFACSGSIDPLTYIPPAVVTPWNGRWHSGSGPKLRAQIVDCADERLASLRDAVIAADSAIARDDKARDVRQLRNYLSDETVEWIDATWIIDDAGEISPVWIAGTGGNWGSQDLGVTAIRAALAIASRDESADYHVTAYGNRDMTALEFLLLVEGLIAMSPSTLRRLSQDRTQPCRSEHCVAETVVAGEKTVGSWWLPLWPNPVAYPELRAVLSDHVGWASDVAAALWTCSGSVPAGITQYSRCAIIRSAGDIIRGLQP
jgi:hypothetical protein